MCCIVVFVTDSMIRETPLPNFSSRSRFFSEAVGIAAFDELHYPFERKSGLGGEHEMNVVGHDDEFIELEESAITVAD